MALKVINPGQGVQAQIAPLEMRLPQGPTLKLDDSVGKGAKDLMAAVNDYAARKQKLRDEEDLATALTDLQKRAVEYQAGWKQTHFGRDAADAGSVFRAHVEDEAQKVLKQFRGRPEVAAAFRTRAQQISLAGFQHGSEYEMGQELQYRKDNLAGQKEALKGIVQQGTPEQIALAMDTYRRSRQAFFPGMDHGKDDVALEKAVALGMVQRHLTIGDISAAQSALGAAAKRGLLSPDEMAKGQALIGGAVKDQVTAAVNSGDVEGARRIAAEAGIGAGEKFSGTVPGLPQSVAAKIEAEAVRQGVDPILAKAVAMQESHGRQSEKSPAGAVGVMQVMPQFVNEFGGGDPYNEDDNIRIGITELKQRLKEANGDVREALLRYNWGPGNVQAYKKTGKGVKGQAMPKEAQEYADRVLGRIKGGSTPGASPAVAAQVQAVLDLGRADEFGEMLVQKMAAGKISPSEAMAECVKLPNHKAVARALHHVTQQMTLQRVAEAEEQRSAVVDVNNVYQEYLKRAQENPGEAYTWFNGVLAEADTAAAGQKTGKAVTYAQGLHRLGQAIKETIDNEGISKEARMANYRAWYDANPAADDNAKRKKMGELGLDAKQCEEAEKYLGLADAYPFTQLSEWIAKLSGSANKVQVYSAFLKHPRVASGEKLNQAQVKNILANLIQIEIKRPWYRPDQSIYKAMAKGEDLHDIDIPDEEASAISRQLQHSLGDRYSKRTADQKRAMIEAEYLRRKGLPYNMFAEIPRAEFDAIWAEKKAKAPYFDKLSKATQAKIVANEWAKRHNFTEYKGIVGQREQQEEDRVEKAYNADREKK